MTTIHQHAQEAAAQYRLLIIAARDYPYRDFKDTRDELLARWLRVVRDWSLWRAGFEREETELLGAFGRLPNLFHVGHPRGPVV